MEPKDERHAIFARNLQRAATDKGLDSPTKLQRALRHPRFPTITDWWNGKAIPRDPELRAKLTEVLGVTIDELIGIASGQEPPFPSWARFLEALRAEGDQLSDDEARALKSQLWTTGQPSVGDYFALLSIVRRPRTRA